MQQNLLQLFEYNFWANDQFIVRLQNKIPLPPDIQNFMSHILNAHQIWIGRVLANANLPKIWAERDPQSWEETNIELYNQTTDLLKSEKLDSRISYKNSKGQLYENRLWEILYHIINHSTHHRAQVALLMRKNDILPPASDLIFYLR